MLIFCHCRPSKSKQQRFPAQKKMCMKTTHLKMLALENGQKKYLSIINGNGDISGTFAKKIVFVYLCLSISLALHLTPLQPLSPAVSLSVSLSVSPCFSFPISSSCSLSLPLCHSLSISFSPLSIFVGGVVLVMIEVVLVMIEVVLVMIEVVLVMI